MLMQLIEESPTLTPEVIETLLAQFLPKNAKNKPASYRLAVEVCTGASDRLQRYVCQYFAEVITSTVSGSRDSDESEDEGAKRGSKLAAKALPQDFLMAHALIKQVNRSVPSLLLNVIPQLEEELTAEKPEYRKLATEVVGAMIGEKMGQGDLAAKYPGTWKEWLGRYKDKVPVVRVAMIESLRKIWTEHPELGKDIEGESPCMKTWVID
jgi:sister-chromatid-cohesion protein PDS5